MLLLQILFCLLLQNTTTTIIIITNTITIIITTTTNNNDDDNYLYPNTNNKFYLSYIYFLYWYTLLPPFLLTGRAPKPLLAVGKKNAKKGYVIINL